MMTLTADRGYLSDGDIIAEERTSGGVSEAIWYAYSGGGSLAGERITITERTWRVTSPGSMTMAGT